MERKLTGIERSIDVRNRVSSGQIIDRIVEDTTQVSREGVYYHVLLPQGWRFYGLRGDKVNHYDFWREVVLPSAVANYFPRDKDRGQHVYRVLKEAYCGFPRGRVSVSADGYEVLQGDDLPLSIAKPNVERYFEIFDKARWSFYDHEQCSIDSKEAVRLEFGITKDWPAVVDV